jgi:hypothetical protein
MLLPKNYIRACLHSALLLMVLSGIGHIHSHQCLDGQEPAMQVHFENFKGHPQHPADELHVDVEHELTPAGLPGKPPEQDSPYVLLASVLLFVLPQPARPQLLISSQPNDYQAHAELLPPLRGPPALSS